MLTRGKKKDQIRWREDQPDTFYYMFKAKANSRPKKIVVLITLSYVINATEYVDIAFLGRYRYQKMTKEAVQKSELTRVHFNPRKDWHNDLMFVDGI